LEIAFLQSHSTIKISASAPLFISKGCNSNIGSALKIKMW
jgi:hypothetical protein